MRKVLNLHFDTHMVKSVKRLSKTVSNTNYSICYSYNYSDKTWCDKRQVTAFMLILFFYIISTLKVYLNYFYLNSTLFRAGLEWFKSID